MKVLLIEDDRLIGEGISSGLKRDQYDVHWVRDGESALGVVCDPGYSAIVLDLGLPRISGLEVLRHARNKKCNTPVLILTAQDSIEDRVAGLDAGADDYLTKPFDLDELRARLRALIRRSVGAADEILRYRDIEIHVASHTVTKAGMAVVLSRREFAMLLEMVSSVGRVLSKDRLEEKLYGWSDDVESNTIEVYVHHLRKKLGSDIIKTIRGVGYMVPNE